MEQAQTQYCSQGTQTEVTLINQKSFLDDTVTDNDPEDFNWVPYVDQCHENNFMPSGDGNPTPDKERKFMVFETQLRLLTDFCHDCGKQQLHMKKDINGTCIMCSYLCECGSSFYWTSQPHSGTMPYGNLLTAAAIMFSGGSATRILNMMKHLKLACFTERTYFRLQQFYLIPSIQELYNLKQNVLLSRLKNSIQVAGNGRCCSPGHTAKYGSYSFLEMDTGKIIHTELVQASPCMYSKSSILCT